MYNKDFLNEKLKVFTTYLMRGAVEPGIIVWGTMCDAELTNTEGSGGYFFQIEQSDLSDIYEEFAFLTDHTSESWKNHFENGAKEHNVDITSDSLYLHLVVYGKGLF